MKNLKKKYPDINFNSINEKDIIFFCRDTLNYLTKKEDKEKFEKEILNIIKKKEWDYYVKDIDKAIMLLYPIHNNSTILVSYLLPKYDLSQYNKELSHALASSIPQKSNKTMLFLLEKEMHPQYKTDMLMLAYNMKFNVAEDYVKFYDEKINLLIEKHIDFKNLCEEFIKNNDAIFNADLVFEILGNHPLNIKDKSEILQTVLESKKTNNSKFKNKIFEKFELLIKLQLELVDKNIINQNKLKI